MSARAPERIITIEIVLPDSEIERIAQRVAALLVENGSGDGAALSTAQAAQFCNCSEAHLEGLRSRGGGPKFVKLGGRHVRYFKADLVAWMRTNARANTSKEET